MKKLLFLLFLAPSFIFSQIATENLIPFSLDTDLDGMINVIDTDDDNDGILDNLDAFPLNAAQSGPTTGTVTVNATHDAGLQSNSAAAASNNYGAVATVQTKNFQRSLLIKFSKPNVNVFAATLTINTSSENDPLEIYYLPDTLWSESTITYNTTNFTGQQLLGTTTVPASGKYTFNIPINILPSTTGSFTLLVYDPNDPGGATELLYTKETAGKAPTVKFDYFTPVVPRLIIDQSDGTVKYVAGSPFKIKYKLNQAPTSSVYLPLEVSDPAKASIVGNKVLTFDASNWNVFKTLDIQSLNIGKFDVNIRPLHSSDNFYNGFNNNDLKEYTIQATDITNIAAWTIATGQTLSINLNAVSGVGSTKFKFKVLSGPAGLNIVETSGKLSFSPLSNQVGVQTVIIEVTDEFGNKSYFETTVTVTNSGAPNPTGIFVDMNLSLDPLADGTLAHPFNNIAPAANYAATHGGGNVLVRGGEFDLMAIQTITGAATSTSPIVIKPLPGEHVKINFDLLNAIVFDTMSNYITVEGFEIDGGTDEIDFWCIVAQAFWGDPSIARGGGIALNIDGENINIFNNYIHDCYQKAIEIRGARYAKVYGNIIHHIATTSLSGGHGIMRQQKGREFFTDDVFGKYRWDISQNMIYNVEQRIYSWVPAKGYIEMTRDEGKPILVDDPKDTNGVQEYMTARIKNNVLAFGSIDHLRLKSTPNLEVSRNSVYTAAPHADAITDKPGDSPTPKFTNFKFLNNAAQVKPGRTAMEVDDAINQATAAPGSMPTVYGNKAKGFVKPLNYTGLDTLPTTQLFVNPDNGNFRINPALGLPDSLGIDVTILTQLEARAAAYSAIVKWDGFNNDELKLSQTILDNIPGLNDGITGNDTVFTNIGIMAADKKTIDFTVVNGAWKAMTGSTAHQEFRLNEEYSHWYRVTDSIYKNVNNLPYERIRWGESVLKQNQVFDNDWLTVSQITSTTTPCIEGLHESFTLDGDLLIDFEGFVPTVGNTYDIIKAQNITTANTGKLFDRVLFEVPLLDSFTLTIVTTPTGKAVRLTIVPKGNCGLVTNKNDAGAGSLRDALSCIADGGTITLSSALSNDTIKLTTTKLTINKNVNIVSQSNTIRLQNCTPSEIEVAAGKNVALSNFTILSDVFLNKGNLTNTNMTFKSKNSVITANFINSTGSTMQAIDAVRIE